MKRRAISFVLALALMMSCLPVMPARASELEITAAEEAVETMQESTAVEAPAETAEEASEPEETVVPTEAATAPTEEVSVPAEETSAPIEEPSEPETQPGETAAEETVPETIATVETEAAEVTEELIETITEPVMLGTTASGTFGYDLTWVLDDTGVLTISGTGDIDYYPWYDHRSEIQTVVIGDGVTSIGWYAFYGCSNLTEITIPNSVTAIGDSAFEGCTSLTEITIPDSVTAIGHQAFLNCSSLSDITIPNTVTSIGSRAFGGCASLKSITIPDSVTVIDYAVFGGCSSLTKITLPGSVTTIGGNAFLNCSSLSDITIPNSVTSIGDCAFEACTSLKSITIPDSVTTIGVGAFSSCTSLVSVTIGSGVVSIGDNAFYNCQSLSSITIPDGVTSIGNYAFYNCSNLKSITIPDSVTSVGYSVFSGCTGLTSAVVGDGMTSIVNNMFGSCTSLASVTIGSGVVSIGDNAFYNCQSLSSITIPDGVTSIGQWAFYNCENLSAVNIPNGVTSVGSYAFYSCSSLRSITIPESVTAISNGMFSSCSKLNSVTLPNGITAIGSYAFSGCSRLSNIVIPSGVTEIGAGAFQGCSALTSVSIPEGITNIADSTFDSTGLTQVTIPSHVTAIGKRAFNWCDDLTSITISESVDTIGESAFQGCQKLAKVSVPDSVTSIGDNAFASCYNLTSVDLGSGVTDIGESAFRWCQNLTSITIPAGVKLIDYSAFANCHSLTAILFQGNAPEIFDEAFLNVTASAYYPSGNGTWIPSVQQDYGGTISWSKYSTSTLNIIAQPAEQKVTEGSSAVFRVSTVGQELTYQWQYRTSSSGSWKSTTLTGCETDTLTVSATTGRNGYQYRCKITNADGSVKYSQAAYLYVLGVKTQPKDAIAAVGDSVTFTVTATGYQKYYQWQYRTSSSGEWKYSTVSSASKSTLNVSATAGKNGYQYRCQIMDGTGNMIYSDAATLYVLSIRSHPAAKKVIAGTNATFTVKAGGADLSYQWQYRTSSSGSWKSTTLTGNKTDTLTVSATTSRNGYQYRCKVTDGSGNTVYSNAATLYVLGVKTQPETAYAKSGDTAAFTVSATGYQKTYQWQYRTSATGSWKNSTVSSASKSTLNVSATTGKNGYEYRCQITDGAGNVIYTDNATLHVLYISSSPATQKVIAGENAVFTVNAKGGDLHYQWQYRTSSSGSWKSTTLTGCKTDTLTVSATTGRNGYQYRCKVTDGGGNTVYSSAAYLYALGVKAQPVTAYAKTGNTAAFSVSATGYKKTYQWQYRTSATGSWKNSTVSSASEATLNVSATTGKNGYEYRCQITDGAGNVIYTDIVTLYVLGIKTQPADVTAAVGDNVVFSVVATGGELTYQWQYRTSSSGSWKSTTASGNKTAVMTTSAKASRDGYQYRCKVTDGAGNTIYSNAADLTVE